MMADNGIWVKRVARRWYVWYGRSWEPYWFQKRGVERYAQINGVPFPSKTTAISFAHELEKEYVALEYGVQVIE